MPGTKLIFEAIGKDGENGRTERLRFLGPKMINN